MIIFKPHYFLNRNLTLLSKLTPRLTNCQLRNMFSIVIFDAFCNNKIIVIFIIIKFEDYRPLSKMAKDTFYK